MSGGYSQPTAEIKFQSFKPALPGRSILLSTVGTSLALHGGLSVGAWTLGALTDSAEAKDWLWPVGFVANAWYQSVGRAVLQYGVPFTAALSSLRWQEKLLVSIGAVSLDVHYQQTESGLTCIAHGCYDLGYEALLPYSDPHDQTREGGSTL